MKRRPVLLVFGAVAVLLVAAVATLFLPAVQHRLLLHAVADVPGLSFKVDHVAVGLGAAELRGLEVRREGMVFRAPSVTARYSGWALLARRAIDVEELTATDWELELAESAAAPAANPAGPEMAAQAFAGFLAPLQLPVPARIENVQIGGRIRVSATQTAECSVQGRLLVPGQDAVTDLHFKWADTGAEAVAPALDWVGRVTTTVSAAGAVDSLSLEGTLAMPVAKAGAPEPGLVTNVTVARASAGEEIVAVAVGLSTAQDGDAPLVRANLRHRTGGSRVEGDWALDVRREQLAGVANIDKLPDFNAAAQGRFGVEADSGDFTADGKATVAASRFQRIRRDLATVGALTGRLDFALERKGDAVRLSRAELAVDDSRGSVLKLTALQPVGYHLDTRAVDFANPGTDLARLEFGGLPLAWVQPWLGDTAVGGTVDSGEFRLKGNGSAWSVETAKPLAFSGVRYGTAKRPVVDRLAGTLGLRASVQGEAFAVDSLDLALRSGGGAPFEALKLGLTAKLDPDGSGKLQLPVTLENAGRRSQFALAGEWTISGDKRAVQARLTGDLVYLRDVSAFAALVPASPAPATPAVPAVKDNNKTKPAATALRMSGKDEHAFWAGIDGRVDVDLKRLVLDAEEITGLQAVLVCDPQKLSLEKLSARTKSAPLEASFGIAFDAAKPVPYKLQGNCAFPGFDLGAWLRAANPGEEPAIETVLDVKAQLAGQGSNLDSLLDGLRGDFQLVGGPGLVRIKDKRVEAASEIGGFVLGLLSKDKQKPAVTAGSELLAEMREFRFERLEASLLRAEDMNLQFRTIDIRSASKRLSGSGTARHVAGRMIDEYPLQLEMSLAGKDNFAALLDKAGLLDGTKDELGYLKMKQGFTVGGTVGEPDWKKMLERFGTGIGAGLLGGW